MALFRATRALSSAVYPALAGRSVFVTGGATGIGEALVRAFVAQRAQVHFIDVQDEAGEALAAELGPLARYSHVDVTDVAALQGVIATQEKVDVLINNVANDTRHHPADVTPEFWRKCMAVNLDATFFAVQAAIPKMKAAGGGAIINFSSINALLGPEDMPGYVSAKAGLLGMTKALARQYGRDHIRVNVILPGWVVTERQLDKWLTPEAEAQWSELVAIKERILPPDVASLALFLADEGSARITGQQFIIDAGRV
jgi:D-xylose 1-dehydrogenase